MQRQWFCTLSVGQKYSQEGLLRRASIPWGRGKVTVVPQSRCLHLKSGPVVCHGLGCYSEYDSLIQVVYAVFPGCPCFSNSPTWMAERPEGGRAKRVMGGGTKVAGGPGPQNPQRLAAHPSPALLSSLCGSIHAVGKEVPTPFCRITGCLNGADAQGQPGTCGDAITHK